MYHNSSLYLTYLSIKPRLSRWDRNGTLISKLGGKLWDIDIKHLTVSHCHHKACMQRTVGVRATQKEGGGGKASRMRSLHFCKAFLPLDLRLVERKRHADTGFLGFFLTFELSPEGSAVWNANLCDSAKGRSLVGRAPLLLWMAVCECFASQWSKCASSASREMQPKYSTHDRQSPEHAASLSPLKSKLEHSQCRMITAWSHMWYLT